MDISHLPKQPGVYKITGKENGFIYFGSAGTQGIYKRIVKHFHDLLIDKHHSWILQRDWNKFGENNFEVETILVCHPTKAKKIEQELIDARGVGEENGSYNVLDKVDHSSLPNSTKEKIKKAHRNPNLIIATNKSGHKGVCFYKRGQKWKASIHRYGHSYHIGYYETAEEASREYQKVNGLNDDEFEQWWKNEYETKRKDGQYQWGCNSSKAKLTQKQVDEINGLWATGKYTQKEIGKMFGVCASNISRTINKKHHWL